MEEFEKKYFVVDLKLNLEEAQERKIEHLINKLNIKDGMTILDIGCGWGGLCFAIAKKYPSVKVLGVTLSDEQIKYANEIKAMRNIQNVEFRSIDYRDVTEKFDRIVSVGMLEHVGQIYLKTYFQKVESLLNEGGVSLIHTIGRINSPRATVPFIRKYIFPGGYIPSHSEVTTALETTKMIISDNEILRLHYAFTLRCWLENFRKNKIEIESEMGERFFKMFEFYFAAAEMSFVYGHFVNYQIQLVKNRFPLPITRDYLYRNSK